MVKVSRDSQMLESELRWEKDQKVWCLPQPMWAAGVGGVGSDAVSYILRGGEVPFLNWLR